MDVRVRVPLVALSKAINKKCQTMRIFKRENCSTLIRKTTKDRFGNVIVLSGTHSYEWSVSIIAKHFNKTIMYQNRVDAEREYKILRKLYQ